MQISFIENLQVILIYSYHMNLMSKSHVKYDTCMCTSLCDCRLVQTVSPAHDGGLVLFMVNKL